MNFLFPFLRIALSLKQLFQQLENVKQGYTKYPNVTLFLKHMVFEASSLKYQIMFNFQVFISL